MPKHGSIKSTYVRCMLCLCTFWHVLSRTRLVSARLIPLCLVRVVSSSLVTSRLVLYRFVLYVLSRLVSSRLGSSYIALSCTCSCLVTSRLGSSYIALSWTCCLVSSRHVSARLISLCLVLVSSCLVSPYFVSSRLGSARLICFVLDVLSRLVSSRLGSSYIALSCTCCLVFGSSDLILPYLFTNDRKRRVPSTFRTDVYTPLSGGSGQNGGPARARAEWACPNARASVLFGTATATGRRTLCCALVRRCPIRSVECR